MIKVVFFLITFFISLSNSIAEEIDCNQFDKLSAKYVECSALKLKEKSKTKGRRYIHKKNWRECFNYKFNKINWKKNHKTFKHWFQN